jgi:hypothetical protein
MKLIEVRATIRRACKNDLFSGDVFNLKAKQGIKDNVTVFYRHPQTKQIEGPIVLKQTDVFHSVYTAYVFGSIGVINVKPDFDKDFVFDLVLREANMSDFLDHLEIVKTNITYYTYHSQILQGPFYTDRSTNDIYLSNMMLKNCIYVVNERQHFIKKEFKKSA